MVNLIVCSTDHYMIHMCVLIHRTGHSRLPKRSIQVSGPFETWELVEVPWYLAGMLEFRLAFALAD